MGKIEKVTRGKTSSPPRILVYGTEGIGKSTFAAGAPDPVFIQTEDGLDSLDVAKFPLSGNYKDVIENIRAVRDEEHDFQTLVIDSVDWLERLIHEHVVAQDGATSIELACGGYGRGYKKALDHFRDILTALDQVRARGLAVILVAHAKVERFEDPEHPAYDRHSPRLHKDASALVCEWVDGIFFATRRTATRTSDEKSGKRVLATSVGKDGAERVLRVNGSPACVAKNRFGLQGDLPLSWKSFVEALA